MTRTAVVSDIHGNLPALVAVERDALAQGCTRFLNLGDILSGPLWPSETADWLMERNWPTIAGNHERQVLTLPADRIGPSDRFTRAELTERHIQWLTSLPDVLSIDEMLLVHGTPRSDVEHLLETVERSGIRRASEAEIEEKLGNATAPLTLCGHSHVAGLVQLPDGRAVANPGSVGLQAFDDDQPFAYRVENGDPRARYAIVAHREVMFRQVEYDHLAAAAKAEGEGFVGWAAGLAAGRL